MSSRERERDACDTERETPVTSIDITLKSRVRDACDRERERDACDVNRYHAEIASDHAYDYLDGASTERVASTRKRQEAWRLSASA